MPSGRRSLTRGNVFQVHGVDGRGEVVLRKRLARSKVLEFFATTCRAAWLASRRAAWCAADWVRAGKRDQSAVECGELAL